jgi:3-hydroxyisobutyrate dehydrogenase-like beta-hydroxyacid dehydrogenase
LKNRPEPRVDPRILIERNDAALQELLNNPIYKGVIKAELEAYRMCEKQALDPASTNDLIRIAQGGRIAYESCTNLARKIHNERYAKYVARLSQEELATMAKDQARGEADMDGRRPAL